MVRVCFVCLGNICRSPTAAGVMRHLVEQAGLAHRIEIDSAGTSAYHTGEPPDSRSRATAKRRGIVISGAARQFVAGDFERFDYVLAMDASNLDDLSRMARSDAHRARLHLLRSFDPEAGSGASVPDPYYGGERGFDEVLDYCLAACAALLAHLRKEHGLG